MKLKLKFLLLFFLVFLLGNVFVFAQDSSSTTDECDGISLNTNVPFIGDCISLGSSSDVNTTTAFAYLMGGLTKILMTAILIFSFLMVIVGGVMMISGGFNSGAYDKGKKVVKNVLISLILLGSSGLILKLINPNFFGG